MSPIFQDIIATTGQENLLPGLIICAVAVLLNIPRVFLKGNESLKWISLVLFTLGLLLCIGGAAKTSSTWKAASNVLQDSSEWKVTAEPGLLPGSRDAVFTTRWDQLRIPQRTYKKLQKKYPETLPEINFSP